MRYALVLYGDQNTWGNQTETEHRDEMSRFARFEQEAAERGVLLHQFALSEIERATLVGSDGTASKGVSGPGPHVGAMYVIEADGEAEAADWARKIPLNGDGGFSHIEIRPI